MSARNCLGTGLKRCLPIAKERSGIGNSGWTGALGESKLEKLPVTDPLATSSVLTLLEDREGDLWAGMESEGLHILRDARFRTYGEREGLVSEATTAVTEDLENWRASRGHPG